MRLSLTGSALNRSFQQLPHTQGRAGGASEVLRELSRRWGSGLVPRQVAVGLPPCAPAPRSEANPGEPRRVFTDLRPHRWP